MKDILSSQCSGQRKCEAVEVHHFGSLVEQVKLEMVWLGDKAGVSQAYSDSSLFSMDVGLYSTEGALLASLFLVRGALSCEIAPAYRSYT